MRAVRVSGSAAGLVVLATFWSFAGCGLTLDYDPPSERDAGLDARATLDAGDRDSGTAGDAGAVECRTSAECDDHAACNGVELCLEGRCALGEPIACDDGNPCNGVESCAAGTCVTSPVACPSDDDPCNGEETCDPLLGCVVLEPLDCDDLLDCTADSCDARDGCRHEPVDALCTDGPGGRCVVGEGCQYSVCDATTCVAGPCETASCSGATCVRVGLCEAGERCCAGACAPIGCADDDPCTNDTCGPSGCLHVPATGANCSDGDACTVGDRCALGTCTAGSRLSCSDGDPCTEDRCESATGACRSTPSSGAPCSDGNACTAGDVCADGVCRPGTGALLCMPLVPCVSSSCDPGLGCLDVALPPGTACGPDRECDASGVCECRSGTADCDFDGTCECDGVCDPGMGACRARCTSSFGCTAAERCCLSTGVCHPSGCLGCCPLVTVVDGGL